MLMSGDAFVEFGGQAVIEAEQYHVTTVGTSGDAWTSQTDGQASDGTYLVAGPNNGTWKGATTNGPRLDYNVYFQNAGTYYVWAHLRADNGNDDSIHVGLDGTAVTLSGSGFGLSPGGSDSTWRWGSQISGQPVQLVVDEPGLATVNVWMREDGIQFDKLLLTTDPSLNPTGIGQTLSGQESLAAADDQVDVTPGSAVTIDVLANDLVIDGPATVSLLSEPGYGSATVNADQSITFTHPLTDNSVTTLSYRITDANNQIADATLTLTPALTPLLDENFNEGDFNGWTLNTDTNTSQGPANWVVENGQLAETTNITDGDLNLSTWAIWDDPAALNWSNITFEIDVRSTDNDIVGLLFNYQDQDNYYLYEGSGFRHWLYKRVDGVLTELITVNSSGYTTFASHRFRITASDGQIQVTRDGVDVLGGPIAETSLTRGTVGLSNRANEASYFDNVSVVTTNQLPTAIDLSTTTLNGNTPSNTPLATLTTTDADPTDLHTYTLVGGDTASFQIVGDELRTSASLSVQTQTSYPITIRSTDDSGGIIERAFTLDYQTPAVLLTADFSTATQPPLRESSSLQNINKSSDFDRLSATTPRLNVQGSAALSAINQNRPSAVSPRYHPVAWQALRAPAPVNTATDSSGPASLSPNPLAETQPQANLLDAAMMPSVDVLAIWQRFLTDLESTPASTPPDQATAEVATTP